MKKITYLLISLSLFAVSCGSTMPNLFGKKTPHEKYEEKLKDTGMAHTPEGRLWLAVSEKALSQAQPVPVPYKLQGYFHMDKPRALGLSFKARQGEQIVFNLNRDPGFVLYADVYREVGGSREHFMAIENEEHVFSFHVNETGNYIIRLQPQLDASGNYDLSISSGPSFDFPVSGTKARVGSFWGASRDAGKRSHEGIDIFAPKRTPVVAIADGYVRSVKEAGLGGKTVSLRPAGTNYSLYYAHLDEQLVREGQYVKKGEVLGLVGNTGNAKTTPPHLHFGIYSNGAAVDPFPFVNKEVKQAAAVPNKELDVILKVTRTHKNTLGSTIKLNTQWVPLAVTAKGYIAESQEGEIMMMPFANVKAVKKPAGEKGLTVNP